MRIKLDKIQYIYDKKTVMEKSAVSDISLEIKEGEFVSFLGQTGSGKSTLLSIIAGIEKPNSGSVEVDGELSMMLQNPESQLFAQTVLEDVMYGPQNIGLDFEEAKKASVNTLKLVGIDEQLFDTDPSKLSGGQKRKVALAGILAMQRPLVLLDEPTAGLDSVSAREIMKALSSLNKKGVTIVMATHDCEISAKYASRVVVMNEGNVVLDDKPSKIFASPEKLQKYGINIPSIYMIGSMLFKKGLIKDGCIKTAQEIVDSLNIKK